LTQIWVETTQHFLECLVRIRNRGWFRVDCM